MEWKKTKLVRWIAGPFTITEEMGSRRPYRLDGTGEQPQHFENLTEAKAQASTLNELNLQRNEVARLRAELDELRHPGRWPEGTPKGWDQHDEAAALDARRSQIEAGEDRLAAQRFDGITDEEEEGDRPIEDAYADQNDDGPRLAINHG